MMNFDIDSLNDEQKQALFQTEGVVLVTAGAGSGKTRLLTHRICHLIEKGVSPYNILAITFTNKATNEMKDRLFSMGVSRVWISTFHSMCVRILRENIDRLEGYDKNFTIFDKSDREKFIRKFLKPYQYESCEEKNELNTISRYLDEMKNKGLGVDEYFDLLKESGVCKNLEFYRDICMNYEEYLHKNNTLDFDDLINFTLFLFCNYNDILERYAMRFQYILVDEFQDTNMAQYKLIKLLAKVHENLFVVGDEDQCVYTWRGANYENLNYLLKDFPDAKIFKLERNYRSSQNIISLANNVISNNRNRIKKNLWTNREKGQAPVVYTAFDEVDEARFIAKEIEELLLKDYEYKDIAVLIRAASLSNNVEKMFGIYGIPYKVFGGFKFYERIEVKMVLSYLALFVNPKDEISLMKIINSPKRGIGEVALTKLQEEAGEMGLLEYLLDDKFKFSKYYSKLEKFVEAFRTLKHGQIECSISKFVEEVINRFGLKSVYSRDNDEDRIKIENIEGLIFNAKKFEEESETPTLQDFLSTTMLANDSDGIQEGGFVSVATIHAVKGLEFKVVFIIGLEEGIFPNERTLNSASELEEERRLMYVAITRAEERIYLLHAEKRFMYGKSNYQKVSRFVGELGIVSKEKPRLFSVAREYEEKSEDFFESGLKVGDTVAHSRFGVGKIVNISDDGLVADIEFDDFGRKSLMLNLANLEKVE